MTSDGYRHKTGNQAEAEQLTSYVSSFTHRHSPFFILLFKADEKCYEMAHFACAPTSLSFLV